MSGHTSFEQTFSYWMRSNLKDAFSGLITQDIDFVFVLSNKKFFFLEEKNSYNARIGPAQKIIFKLFNEYLRDCSNFKGTHICTVTSREEAEKVLVDLIEKIKNDVISRPLYEIDEDTLEKLWDCRGNPPVKKTETERSGYRGSIIREILDTEIKKDFLFIEPIHWIFVNYCSGNFIFIEELINNSQIEETRKKFLKFIDSTFSRVVDSNAVNPKSEAKYKYLGYYQLKFSKTNPDNSSEIYLNERNISKQELIRLLNLDDDSITNYRVF